MKNYILTDGIEQCKSVYFQEKEKNPGKYLFEGWCLDVLGYWLIDRGHLKQALEIFQFMVELEPGEAGWYDSVADAYRALGNKALAIEWYEKALEIKPDQEFSIRKLEEVRRE